MMIDNIGDNGNLAGKRFVFETLGCKLNFSESSHLSRALIEKGMKVADTGELADICLVNTCSVTEVAEKKGRQLVRRLHREHPGARIVVTGCYAQLNPEAFLSLEGVDLIIGARDKGRLLEYIEGLESRGVDGHLVHTAIEEVDSFEASISSEGRTRHFLKVQDGCDYRCSYCTIPKARGKSRNGTIEELVELARGVARSGGREIVLVGVNVGDFGRSTGEQFIDLLRALDEVEGIDRYRISSIEPNLITDEIIRFVAHSKRFAPHFHIPLQSGSDEVLKLMRRRYNRSLFKHKVMLIKEIMPDAFIGVDVIVGMRGELNEYFEDGLNFISELPISKLHVFSYSERPDTDALKILPIVPPEVKHQRSQRLLELSDKKHVAFVQSQLGTQGRVLVEHHGSGADGQWLYGYTANYVRVRLPFRSNMEGRLVEVKLHDIIEGDCVVSGSFIDDERAE